MSTDEESDIDDQTKGQGHIGQKSGGQGQTDDSDCDTSGEKSDAIKNGCKQELESQSLITEKKTAKEEAAVVDEGSGATKKKNPVVNIPVNRLPDIQVSASTNKILHLITLV